ncbi:MAG: two-component response regulator [Candidatus Scalindua rubra]|uniref:histidine kinase n=1 Tax=Candidatus Scalindua rubra TaxID=1872076 RepID=A0A1E3X478_9BACT|nr:MAG: two-component response regulator [Candidatus Scalindua rubra]
MTNNNIGADKSNYLNTLAAGLVHEIKNPLNSISINLQLLREDLQDQNTGEDSKMLKRIQLLQKEVYRLENILSDFLRFAKRHELHLENCDINGIIDSVLDFISPEAMQNSIRILKSFDTELPECNLDSNAIKQALLNVILNAQQAMPKGGELIVRTYRNGGYIFIDITDTGVGITKDEIDKVFQVYYSTKKTGTGLGLPTAKRIIEENKGTISIRSEDGKGSSFLIKIPINIESQKKNSMVREANILIIDDEKDQAEAIAESLRNIGYKCSTAVSGNKVLDIIRRDRIDVVITDLVMHDIDGMEILKETKEKSPDTEVVLVTGYGTVENAVTAMQKGAATYLLKPININQLRAVVDKIVEKQDLVRNNIELHKQLEEKFGVAGIVGNSQQMHRIFNILKQISSTTATVLIMGESGTGKELIATALHYNSPRKNNPFVVLNSAAISETLLESELFGHEKGAFTGALNQRKGKFEYANNGTLFLDEIGDMPLSTQAKLLRVIEDGRIVRVGSNEPIKVDVRIIAATNKDLGELVKEGKFREDLYFRFNVICLRLPPLRERQEDIFLLVDTFIKELSKKHGKKIKDLTPEARKILFRYNWPGNVRELKNCIESMIVINQNDILDLNDIPEHIYKSNKNALPGPVFPVGITLQEMEKELIKNTLAYVGGNRGETARVLGIGERTLYRKLDRYGLK